MTDNRTPPPQVWPTLRANDARALITFLVDAFGFVETVVHGEGDRVDHAQLSWPLGGGIMLGSANRGDDDAWALQPGTFGCYVVTDDADKRARARGRRGRRDHPRAVRHRLRLAGFRRPRPGGQSVAVRHLPRRAPAVLDQPDIQKTGPSRSLIHSRSRKPPPRLRTPRDPGKRPLPGPDHPKSRKPGSYGSSSINPNPEPAPAALINSRSWKAGSHGSPRGRFQGSRVDHGLGGRAGRARRVAMGGRGRAGSGAGPGAGPGRERGRDDAAGPGRRGGDGWLVGGV